MNESLKAALQLAIETCSSGLPEESVLEEHGGWIIEKDGNHEFHFITNQLAGSPRANVLYIGDRHDIAKKIVKKLFGGYKNYATFHTHPQFTVRPSDIDLTAMFQVSPVSFIYSPVFRQIGMYTYKGRNKENDGQLFSQEFYDVTGDEKLEFTKGKFKNKQTEE